MQRIGIVIHPTRPVLDAVRVVNTWTSARGLELVQVPAGDQPQVAAAGTVSGCDLIVALGGDRTILKALHASASAGTPVMGVAYGSLGALTTVPTHELERALDRFATGAWRPRPLAALVVRAAEETLASAVNDIVVARGRGTQLRVDVSVDGSSTPASRATE